MTTTNTSPNGARAKILRALLKDGMLTVKDLAREACLKPDQARDNAIAAKKDGLVTSELDNVTNSVAYKITSKGRDHCAGVAHSLPKADAQESTADDAAKDLDGRSPIHKERDSLIRERDKLLTERDEARRDADLLRESAGRMECTIDNFHKSISERNAAEDASDAAINERLSKYDALVGENNKLAEDIANLNSIRDEQRRTILALESRAPAHEITEYAVLHENGYVQTAGKSREEAIANAMVLASENKDLIGVYGLVLIGTVEIRPVFVGSEP